jgi:hypothetical protein
LRSSRVKVFVPSEGKPVAPLTVSMHRARLRRVEDKARIQTGTRPVNIARI